MSTHADTPHPLPSHQHPRPPQDAQATTTLAIPTGRIACEGCAAIVERRLRTSPHVLGVHVDAEHQVAHVQVDEGMVTAEALANSSP
jgi:copper chaperone CopZ